MTDTIIICTTVLITVLILHHAFNLYIDYKCWETSSILKKEAIDLEDKK